MIIMLASLYNVLVLQSFVFDRFIFDVSIIWHMPW